MACKNKNVYKVIFGNCPKTGSKNFTKIPNIIKYPYKCGDINLRPQICTLEYVAVCGWFCKSVKCKKYPYK